MLRAVAGGVAAPVSLSRWFLLVISAAAVCVAAGKRYAELRRAEADNSADKLGAKVRRAQVDKIPYMLVVGEKDMAARVVSPRTRDGQQLPAHAIDAICARLAAEGKVPFPGGVHQTGSTA